MSFGTRTTVLVGSSVTCYPTRIGYELTLIATSRQDHKCAFLILAFYIGEINGNYANQQRWLKCTTLHFTVVNDILLVFGISSAKIGHIVISTKEI